MTFAREFFVVACFFFTACGPGVIAGSETGSETGDGDGDPADTWAEIRCAEMGAGVEAHFGRHADAEDSFSLVISDAQVRAALDAGVWESLDPDAWGADSCADGLEPSTYHPDHFCVVDHVQSATSCFAGGLFGGARWFTRLEPSCAAVIGPDDAWPDWLCATPPGFIGQHPWDSVACTDGSSSHCVGIDDGVTATVFPRCWVEALPACAGPGDGDGDPGDGDGDPACSHLACPCEAGGCDLNLVCGLSEVCTPCPAGSPGCACAPEASCEVGSCTEGTDGDGTDWSICYPADLISCAIEPCPGDAHCTDTGVCAWPD